MNVRHAAALLLYTRKAGRRGGVTRAMTLWIRLVAARDGSASSAAASQTDNRVTTRKRDVGRADECSADDRWLGETRLTSSAIPVLVFNRVLQIPW